MRIGMVGLGRMGANMTTRLLRGGHEVVVYDVDAQAVSEAAGGGAVGAESLADLVARLDTPRNVWVMVPSGLVTEQTVEQLGGLLATGDCVIDGGNSRWTDTMRRAQQLAVAGVGLIDAGTSGGVWGLAEGYCLMVGGDRQMVDRLAAVFDTLAPADGWAHVGAVGAGHYTKMVHNGVEYALMQGYAEGFELLRASEFDLDLHQIAEVWRSGSVVRSWLLDLAASALEKDPGLEAIGGYVEDSGEGRWTVEAAIDAAVAAPTIALALFARFSSRQDDAFSNRMLAALRNEFGGHAVRPREEPA
ncbi:MAG: decarboxylating 6-phosphogluconate dehydrogenase [Actinomycetota bacterium]|jgi:6-phosphogluconate dehydrogenase|nr:decarboxylating 6-phosphogluconate dehydrogenase [Actinomycetota bacterium]